MTSPRPILHQPDPEPGVELDLLREAHRELQAEHERTRLELERLRDEREMPIGYLPDETTDKGIMLPIILSVIVHSLLVYYALTHITPIIGEKKLPIARYIQLMRRDTVTEAPGAHLKKAPISAPYSNANRQASTPNPTGTSRTMQPGDGDPNIGAASGASSPARNPSPATSQASQDQPAMQRTDPGATAMRSPSPPAAIDWSSAIREAGKPGPGSGGSAAGDSGSIGGEKGFAESGPVSFESQWYDWGEYAEGMVRRIRVNWYANMPPLIRTGMQGIVLIRFTIHRNGSLSEITMLSSSTIPPYDFAAKKAIELSSPLNPLPRDFPNETEHVTVQFFYNSTPPRGTSR